MHENITEEMRSRVFRRKSDFDAGAAHPPQLISFETLPHYTGDLPKYETHGSSGMDLRAQIEVPITIDPQTRFAVPLGFKVAIPFGYELQLRSRSGLALKNGVFVLNGVGTIDSDYRGEVKVILANSSNTPFVVEPQMRICQAVLCPVVQAMINHTTLLPTKRGEGGFGSTGV